MAPPWYAVPPTGYGGINQQVYLMARELSAIGHEVTVFCREGSQAEGYEIVPGFDPSWTADEVSPEYEIRYLVYLTEVYDRIRASRFDLVQEHTNRGAMLAAMLGLPCPVIATIHEPMTEAQIRLLRELNQRVVLVAVSRRQIDQATPVRFRSCIPESIDTGRYRSGVEKRDYLLQLARISPEKGQHIAIEVARKAGLPLVLAGKVDWNAAAYFEREVEPHLGPAVRWIPDVGGDAKLDLLAAARAMLFPIQWEEPFGSAMAEAMTSGTPVLAPPRGSAPELVDPGVTGLLCETTDDFAAAVGQLDRIDPSRCAARARERFSSRDMAFAYEDLYRQVV
ncbi:MAG: glycosyltransferase family 4 protein [Nocardioidaceae bacterium]